MKEQIEQMLESNTPFSVMQYFESFKGSKKETYKKYELIYINKRKELAFKILNQEDILFVKQNSDRIKLIIDNQDGRIYEFNKFKEYKEKNFLNLINY
jgi:hypothetical protein